MFCLTLPTMKFQTRLSMFYVLYLASQWWVGYVLIRVFSEILRMKGEGKQKGSSLSVVSDGYIYELLPFLIFWHLLLYSNPFTVEEWSDSGVGEPELTRAVSPDVVETSTAETATIVHADATGESDTHSYVEISSWHFLDYHCWILVFKATIQTNLKALCCHHAKIHYWRQHIKICPTSREFNLRRYPVWVFYSKLVEICVRWLHLIHVTSLSEPRLVLHVKTWARGRFSEFILHHAFNCLFIYIYYK